MGQKKKLPSVQNNFTNKDSCVSSKLYILRYSAEVVLKRLLRFNAVPFTDVLKS